MDTFAPFLHEFTYQAMANDLLDVEDDKSYRYRFASTHAPGGYEERTATLSDSDTLWTQVRHMHMKDAIDKLMSDFNKFLEENAGYRAGCVRSCGCVCFKCSQRVQPNRQGATSLNDMKDMLAGLPQYQEMREKVCVVSIPIYNPSSPNRQFLNPVFSASDDGSRMHGLV